MLRWVAEAAVVGADGKLYDGGVVDLFNAAGRGAQNAQGQIRLLGRLLSKSAENRAAARSAFSFAPAKPMTHSPQKGRLQTELAVSDLLLVEGVVILCSGR